MSKWIAGQWGQGEWFLGYGEVGGEGIAHGACDLICSNISEILAKQMAASLNAVDALAERMCDTPENVARQIENGAFRFSVQIEGKPPRASIVITDKASAELACALGGFQNTGGDAWENPNPPEGESLPPIEAKWADDY
jgi:hypothetical protein